MPSDFPDEIGLLAADVVALTEYVERQHAELVTLRVMLSEALTIAHSAIAILADRP